jgi:galactokinase
VNLIGDHTDYNQGLALPLAIDRGVTVQWTPRRGGAVTVSSTSFDEAVEMDIHEGSGPPRVTEERPAWSRLVRAMTALCRPGTGGTLTIDADLPIGAGLSSSAALAVALADVFGERGPAEVVARLCRAAEQLAGAPVGIMDPLVCAGGRAGHAMLIDFSSVTWHHVPIPTDAEVVVVDSGQRRSVASSPYGLRVAECEAAAQVIGPLGLAGPSDLDGVRDPRLHRRARHVVSECARVTAVADALLDDDLESAGSLMAESHRSLADDFEVSTPELDDLVGWLCARPGVEGARLTGAGFGGCVVVLGRPGALDPDTLPWPAWRVRAVDGTVSARR